MKFKRFFLAIFLIAGILLISDVASAVQRANIFYDETSLNGGLLWKYDYTFENTSTSDFEFLFSVRLDFNSQYDISNASTAGTWEGFWGNTSPAFFVESHSSNIVSDIAPGEKLSLFSFTADSQIGSTSFTAFFDDHNHNVNMVTGMTSQNPPVVPEPVSTVLFLTGGATMAFRYRQKRKSQSSQ